MRNLCLERPRRTRQCWHSRSSDCPRREAHTTALDHNARAAADVRGAGYPERLALGRERAARPAQDSTWRRDARDAPAAIAPVKQPSRKRLAEVERRLGILDGRR